VWRLAQSENNHNWLQCRFLIIHHQLRVKISGETMRVLKLLSFFVIIALTVSCEDFLMENPKGSLTPDSFFQSSNDLDLALTSMYGAFQQINQQAGRGLYAYIGDDITAMDAGNKSRF